MYIYIFFRNNILFHGRKIPKIFKTETNSSAPLDGTTTSFWVCGSVYVNCIMCFITAGPRRSHNPSGPVAPLRKQSQRVLRTTGHGAPAPWENLCTYVEDENSEPQEGPQNQPLSHQTTQTDILTLQDTKVCIGDSVVETHLSKCTKQHRQTLEAAAIGWKSSELDRSLRSAHTAASVAAHRLWSRSTRCPSRFDKYAQGFNVPAK